MMKLNMKKNMVLLVVLILALSPLAANGEKESSYEGPVEIELWSLLVGNRAEILDGQTARFNESQDDVVVTVIHQGGYNPTREKITAAASAGNLPAIIMVDFLEVAFYVQNGVISPLDDFIPGKVQNDYFPGLMRDLTVDGKLYGIPYNRSTQGLYVNMDLLKKAGIDTPPATWEEYREQAFKVKKLGSDYYYGNAFFHQWFFDAIAYGWGNDLTTPEGKITFNNKEVVDMMSFFQDMLEEGLLIRPPATMGSFEEMNGAYIEGKVATVLESTSWLANMDGVIDFDWEFAFLPAGTGGNAVTAGGGNFALTRTASDTEKEAAAKYFEYISGPEISAEFHMNTGYMPTRKSVLDIPEVKAFHKENPSYLVSVNQLEFARPSSGYTKNVKSVWYRLTAGPIARIIMNDEDVQTVLDEIAAEFQQDIDEAIELGEYIK
jgi:ABC-type glycerol-3-phosphate transport system substrate-binding protein